LKQARVEQDAATAGLEQVHRPSHGAGGAEELKGGTRGDEQEAPVGIEPTNRGFAVAQERLRYTLSHSVPLHQLGFALRNAVVSLHRAPTFVPRLCPIPLP
jgi:hypothetical protein